MYAIISIICARNLIIQNLLPTKQKPDNQAIRNYINLYQWRSESISKVSETRISLAVCRALGIPARSITTLDSGCDYDASLTIDLHYSQDDECLDELDDMTW